MSTPAAVFQSSEKKSLHQIFAGAADFLHRASALAQSLLVSVRLNKAGKLQTAKKKKPVVCQGATDRHLMGPKKKSICADKRSALAVAASLVVPDASALDGQRKLAVR